jgi:hypothetical protein
LKKIGNQGSTGEKVAWSRRRAFALVIIFVSLPYLAVAVLALLVHPFIAVGYLGLVPATPWLYYWAAWLTKFVETGEMEPTQPHLLPKRVGGST